MKLSKGPVFYFVDHLRKNSQADQALNPLTGEKMRTILIALTFLLATACQTVTMTQRGTAKMSTTPTYNERLPFFLFGLIGEHTIDARAVCGGKDIKQMQTKFYFLDGFLEVITIGIYAPRVVHIWCDGSAA